MTTRSISHMEYKYIDTYISFSFGFMLAKDLFIHSTVT